MRRCAATRRACHPRHGCDPPRAAAPAGLVADGLALFNASGAAVASQADAEAVQTADPTDSPGATLRVALEDPMGP